MKARSKRDFFGSRTSWIDKVPEVEKVPLSGRETFFLEELPKELILCDPVIPVIIVAVMVLGITGVVAYKILAYYANKELADYSLLWQTTITAAVSIAASLLYPIYQKLRAKKPKFRFYRRTFFYYDQQIDYRNIFGIYTCYEPSRQGTSLKMIIIKLKDKTIIEIDPHVKGIPTNRIPLIISGFHNRYLRFFNDKAAAARKEY